MLLLTTTDQEAHMSDIPRLIERNGRLYAHYAGPWRDSGPGTRTSRVDHDKPHTLIGSLFAEGLISASDQPIVHNGAVYLIYGWGA
jgi:hypothetical protein